MVMMMMMMMMMMMVDGGEEEGRRGEGGGGGVRAGGGSSDCPVRTPASSFKCSAEGNLIAVWLYSIVFFFSSAETLKL
jgi:hypothetical protein